MKKILLALTVAMATCGMTFAQESEKATNDSTEKVTVTMVFPEGTETTAENDGTKETKNEQHRNITFQAPGLQDNDTAVGIISIIAVFGMPVLITFIVFFFRYINRKARYQLIEKAIAAGQPLPKELLGEEKKTDMYLQGIRNICIGIGLCVFLWLLTGTWSIASVGCLVIALGMGQWLAGMRQRKDEKERMTTENISEEQPASEPSCHSNEESNEAAQ